MLVLSRKKDQKVIIAEGEIEVIVLEIRGDKVRLGFKAPRDIPIHREEVYLSCNESEKAKKENGGSYIR